MLRRTLRRLLGDGQTSDITMSVITDKAYLARRLAAVGNGETTWKAPLITDEEVKRMNTSGPESLLNQAYGGTEPGGVVDHENEEHEKKWGPTRFGDWEKNGIATDF